MKDLFPLSKGEYTATIIQSYYEDDELVLVWCVDSGEHKWHKLFHRIPVSKFGEKVVAKLGQRLELSFFGTIYEEDLFYLQFVGLRARLTVDYVLDKHRRAWCNVIGDYYIELDDPEVDVTRKKTDELYTKKLNKKRLPLQK